jgi:hypothetical protein
MVSIGYEAGAGAVSGSSNSVCIGYQAGSTFIGSNAIVLTSSTGNLTTDIAGGAVVINTGQASTANMGKTRGFFMNQPRIVSTSTALYFNSGTQEITYASCLRELKKNIIDISEEESEKIHQLRPRQFDWIINDRHEYGLIAEETEEISKDFAAYGFTDNPEDDILQGINWNAITACLILEVQKLKKQNDKLQQEVNELKTKTDFGLNERLTLLEKRFSELDISKYF